MYNRKEFLKRSGGAALGLMLGPSLYAGCSASSRIKASGSISAVGIQLYSLRDDLPKDPKGILKQLAAFGYKEVESYEGAQGMFWGMGNKGFKRYMDELGMKIVSSHCDYTHDFERKAAEAAEIGMSYLICPYVGPQKSLDDYKRLADSFNKAGETCKKNGIRFAYHNHDYSFRLQNGQFPQDIFMQHTDKALMDYEMDIYWVVTAGQDPIAWLKKYSGRFRLCHVKDRKKGVTPKQGEPNLSVIVGTGSIDFKTILAAARKEGMQHYILEQEAYEKAPIECVKEGAAYLNKLVF
ncbi:sugar phosphate isomerase/epimerase family protein [Niabella drilacis]|uniref:Sugar phosphate isomerase/epimerase n=1 Tax=Niabella drilacis (strain DSM 25811 / CCM 8410 / CCUG 62505 / LMG 26954 / E90) TaxID=1285928 RepID=A0A1G6W577_NIADE|nr:sugar phosphate isomerase/epimerase [Niabella drilacis]SDD60984.1 Sugar phosphate isomerase/epimerase [Niabella drilacis]